MFSSLKFELGHKVRVYCCSKMLSFQKKFSTHIPKAGLLQALVGNIVHEKHSSWPCGCLKKQKEVSRHAQRNETMGTEQHQARWKSGM